MAKYLIKVRGCDESTRVIVDLSDTEHAAVSKVAGEVTRWGGGCHPTMEVRAASALDIESVDEDQRERGERQHEGEES